MLGRIGATLLFSAKRHRMVIPGRVGATFSAGRLSRPIVGAHVSWPNVVWQACVGFLFGYMVLHPLSMVVFQWLDPRIAASMPEMMAGDLLGPVTHSFRLSMLPMALVFGGIGSLITTFYGYHRLVLTRQRDRLADELGRNEKLSAELQHQARLLKRNNQELARVELANRRTSQFMAHDFKTSLGCVGGFANELLDRPELRDDPEAASALACIRRQAHRMMGNVADLLEFARTREGGAPRLERISATHLLEQAIHDFSLPAHVDRVTLGPKHTSCPPLLADPRLLRRVLCNLISNALKHNDSETRVGLDAVISDCGTEVIFVCRDDGEGVPPEMLPGIFTEFATGDVSTGHSTGLGLAFCKTVIEAHGGRIWCESVQHDGSRFYFTIPIRKEPVSFRISLRKEPNHDQ